ncbi:MAG: hypothetical protein JWN78_2203 [Bacteroidota bacterium]|nr:hypothetical protein [Bacteroidota bacterium]
MKKIITAFIILYNSCLFAQNIFSTDTFTYTINLDLNRNLYLKSVPVDLLKGYCKGEWNAYYPKREMNQCLFDDFLQRFNYDPLNVSSDSTMCWNDYCNDPYFTDIYKQFNRKLKYREIIYYDAQHSIQKQEVLWIQLYYSRKENEEWKHYNGPVFWLQEVMRSSQPIKVYNKDLRSAPWLLSEEFHHPFFITNENKQPEDKKKIERYDKMEEN